MRHPMPLYVVLLLAGITLTACGGSDADVEVARYIDSIIPSIEQAKAAGEALDEEISPPGAGSDVTDAKLWFERGIEIQEKVLDALRAVGDRPAQVGKAHDDYIVAGSELLALNRRIAERLAGAGPGFDIAELANDSELGVARQNRLGDRLEEACKELERNAREAGVKADLRCEKKR